MKTSSSASAEPESESPTTLRKPRRGLRKSLRVAIFVLACLGTLLALFDVVINWSGKRAWEKYARNLPAPGQPLRLADVIPPPLPDAQNFAATPFLASLYKSDEENKAALARWPNLHDKAQDKVIAYLEGSKNGGKAYTRWNRLDLMVWQAALALVQSADSERNLRPEDLASLTNRSDSAAKILAALQVYDPVLEELRAASQRPGARYNVSYEMDNPLLIPLPHLAVLRRVCKLLELRSTALLALAQTELALADIELMLRVADSLKDEPVYISYLVRVACYRLAMGAFWEGLAGPQAWSDAHLSHLQKRWEALDFLRASQKALFGERAMGNSLFDFIQHRRGTRGFAGEFGLNPDSSEERLLARIFSTCFRGWLHYEQLNYNRSLDTFALWEIPQQGPRIDPQLVQNKLDTFAQSTRGPAFVAFWRHRLMSGLLLPALSSTFKKAAEAQALAEMAALACAVERFRLAHGDYPENLQALIPQFVSTIPNDVVSHQPYQYRHTPSGRYILYSIGWDGIDDRGQESERSEMGDWTWRYPED
jgi:hypothetical protein